MSGQKSRNCDQIRDSLVRKWDFVRMEGVFKATIIGKCVGGKQDQIIRTSQSPFRYELRPFAIQSATQSVAFSEYFGNF